MGVRCSSLGRIVATVTWWGERLTLFDHPYNTTRRNERAVEIPCAVTWLKGRGGRGLEVGNVLGHYGMNGHRVVDRWEEAPGVDNIDVFDIEGAYRWIVAISTLEHVRRDEPEKDPTGAWRALGHLRSLLKPGGAMLVTVPLGWNADLDAHLMDGSGADRECTFVRRGASWYQTERLTWKPYGAATPWAESVYVGEWSA